MFHASPSDLDEEKYLTDASIEIVLARRWIEGRGIEWWGVCVCVWSGSYWVRINDNETKGMAKADAATQKKSHIQTFNQQ